MGDAFGPFAKALGHPQGTALSSVSLPWREYKCDLGEAGGPTCKVAGVTDLDCLGLAFVACRVFVSAGTARI